VGTHDGTLIYVEY